MKKFFLALTALFAVSALTACSSDDGFLTDDELDQLNKETSPKFAGLNYLGGNFPDEFDKYNVNNAIIFHSRKELEEYDLSACIVNDTTSYYIHDNNFFVQNHPNSLIANLKDYYKDINWDKQSLVVLTRFNSCINRNLIAFNGSIYHKKGKYYVVMNPVVQTSIFGSMALYRDGAAFVVNSPNLKKKDLVIQVDAKISGAFETGEYEIRDITQPLDFK